MTTFPASFDPYDLWMTRAGVMVRERYYQGRLSGKLGAVAIGVLDWWFPTTSRKLLGATHRRYPITLAQWVRMQAIESESFADACLDALAGCAAVDDGSVMAWGLGFPWMSKNGLYGPETPFVTHTPYVMEALLHIAQSGYSSERALTYFDRTRPFLQSLKVMHEADETLALSYAPVEEPRIVVNANAYAAFSLALHYRRLTQRGEHDAAAQTLDDVRRIVNWVARAQAADGSWQYYADEEPGNFIDCFHSCFILKNLQKTADIAPGVAAACVEPVARGVQFMRESFIGHDGLAKRFVVRDIKDPYVLDLYDQAELLGVLLDQGDLDGAKALAARARQVFFRRGHWYCRRDFFGRLWGRDFLRWGIMPFLYEEHRLTSATDAGT